MSKYITVKLTEDQLNELVKAVEAWKAFGMMGDDPEVVKFKAFNQRLLTKLAKAKS